MRELEVRGQVEFVPLSYTPGRGAPLPDAIDRDDGGIIVWAREKRTGSMALVMIDEEEGCSGSLGKSSTERSTKVEFVLHPYRHGHAEAAEPSGSEGEVCLEQPFELG